MSPRFRIGANVVTKGLGTQRHSAQGRHSGRIHT